MNSPKETVAHPSSANREGGFSDTSPGAGEVDAQPVAAQDDPAIPNPALASGQLEQIEGVANGARHAGRERQQQRKRDKRDVHGWVILDKPVGMTSTHAVAVVKRLFQAKRAGHAGTLDPLASGGLPIALGEATKTVPFVMDGRKRYRFTVRWGEERDTDDSEGRRDRDQRGAPDP